MPSLSILTHPPPLPPVRASARRAHSVTRTKGVKDGGWDRIPRVKLLLLERSVRLVFPGLGHNVSSHPFSHSPPEASRDTKGTR